MSANVPSDFISILDDKIYMLRLQLRSEGDLVAIKLQGQLAAALRIRERIQPNTGAELEKQPIDALAEWCRWERDALAFEPRL